MDAARLNGSDSLATPVGRWKLEMFNSDDMTPENLIEVAEGFNRIVTDGKELAMDLLAGINGATKLTGIAVGTNSTASADGNTAITNPQFKLFEVEPSRVGLTTTYTVLYLTSDPDVNIQEMGLLTASGGKLFNRIAPVGPFNKTSATAIRATITITQA